MTNLNQLKETNLDDSQKQLISQVDAVVKEIETGKFYNKEIESAYEYLEDALNILHYINQSGEHMGGEIMVACGGPNIYIDTRSKEVKGFWGGDTYTNWYGQDAIDLDEALEEMYEGINT